MAKNFIYALSIFSSEAVTASSTATSAAIDLTKYSSNGFFSLYVEATGTGTAKFEYLLSADGTTYLEPSSATDIATGHTASSGPGSDGKDLYPFSPEVARYMKVKITETGGANTITITATLTIQ